MSASRWIRRLTNTDRYELIGGSILRHCGWFTADKIELAQVKSFQVAPEMGFDCVILSLGHTHDKVWLDFDNDLLAILRREIPQLEVGFV